MRRCGAFLRRDAASADGDYRALSCRSRWSTSVSRSTSGSTRREPRVFLSRHALLDAGAEPNSGFWNRAELRDRPVWGGGVAHHAELTRLLLERGADPTDEEAVYHSPETRDYQRRHEAPWSRPANVGDDLALMLIRKHDFHDYDGAKWLLEHGADPNHRAEPGLVPSITPWRATTASR